MARSPFAGKRSLEFQIGAAIILASMSIASSATHPHPPAAVVPLRWDDGVWRVGDKNLTLETVVELFEAGQEADEIARDFEGVERATIYSVIGYYLGHRAELADYLAQRRAQVAAQRAAAHAEAQEIRRRLEARHAR